MPSGCCSTPPATLESSDSSTSARWASTRVATITAPTRPCPPAANSLDAYTRSKTEAEALVLEYHRRRGLPAAIVRPGFIYGERDRTVLPKLLMNLRRGTFAYFGSGEQALNCIYVKNLVHGIFLAAENPGRRRRGLQPDRRRARDARSSSSAGSPSWPACGRPPGTSRLAWREFLATVVEGVAKLRGAKNPPIINKARFKFLGLNLDYSIDKARSVLGYQPPLHLRRGDRAGHGRAPARAHPENPAAPRSPT